MSWCAARPRAEHTGRGKPRGRKRPARLAGAVCALLTAALSASAALAETVAPGQRWAWSANAGWLDARPLEEAGPGLHANDGVVSGWLYAANIGWISAHCLSTASCASVPYGLRMEEIPQQPDRLRLSGHLWSDNAGWIVAHCITTQSCGQTDYGLQVDVMSGRIEGYAWSENLGWISFSCANSGSCGELEYGVGLLPQVVVPVASELFADGFE